MEVAESKESAPVGPPTGAGRTTTNGEQDIVLGIDDSSSLSEIDVSEHEPSDYEAPKAEKAPLENDSEAETERLEESPNNLRPKRDIVVSASGVGPSPSKLAQSTTYDDVEDDEEPTADDSPSKPRSKNNGIPEAVEEALEAEDSTLSESGGNKRKRLGSGDEVVTELGEEEPIKKRRGSVKSDLSEPPAEGTPLSPETTEEPPKANQDHTPAEDIPASDVPVVPAKTKKGKKSKRRTRKGRDADEETEVGGAAEAEAGDEHAQDDEAAEHGEEPDDAEAAAKHEEECKCDLSAAVSSVSNLCCAATKKMSAMESLSELEKEFATLRDK